MKKPTMPILSVRIPKESINTLDMLAGKLRGRGIPKYIVVSAMIKYFEKNPGLLTNEAAYLHEQHLRESHKPRKKPTTAKEVANIVSGMSKEDRDVIKRALEQS